VEDEVLLRARDRGVELGAPAVTPATGALLRVVAATLQARAVVEIGTGAGVAALWLLRGMAPDGVLTTIDPDGAHLRAARSAFADEGVPVPRTRAIARPATEVLPRLADAAYDLVLVTAEPHELGTHLDAAARLLRPGGMLALTDALHGGRVTDPAARDEATLDVRRVLAAVREDPRLVPAMVPLGDGLLLAVRR
jgi:predicted O-methyltransferase YrrM